MSTPGVLAARPPPCHTLVTAGAVHVVCAGRAHHQPTDLLDGPGAALPGDEVAGGCRVVVANIARQTGGAIVGDPASAIGSAACASPHFGAEAWRPTPQVNDGTIDA